MKKRWLSYRLDGEKGQFMRNVKITSITVTEEETKQVREIMSAAGWTFSETVRRCVGACYAELRRTNRLRGDANHGKME